MILLIDNYDSFSYNLYQLLGAQNVQIQVVRNDTITISDISSLSPEALIISPGPKTPKDAGICLEAIRHFAPHMPIFGVCLGHQAICEAFGGKVGAAPQLMHGKSSHINIDTNSPLFANLPQNLQVARYHSLCALTLPESLKTIARTNDTNEPSMIMALTHHTYPTYGVQFHPESILTPQGKIIIQNFLSIVRQFWTTKQQLKESK